MSALSNQNALSDRVHNLNAQLADFFRSKKSFSNIRHVDVSFDLKDLRMFKSKELYTRTFQAKNEMSSRLFHYVNNNWYPFPTNFVVIP